MKQNDVVNMIIGYESGDLTAENTLVLFSELIKDGRAWTLQGHYGRTAKALIDGGYISAEGKILKDINE